MTESKTPEAQGSAGALWFDDPDPRRALGTYLKVNGTPYNQWKSWSVRKLIPRLRVKDDWALDYGCGGGNFTVWLATRGWRVVAADASAHSLAACRLHVTQKGLCAQVRSVQTLPPDYWASLQGQEFGLILAKDVIEHIDDDEGFLRQVKAHLAPNGTAVIVTQKRP